METMINEGLFQEGKAVIIKSLPVPVIEGKIMAGVLTGKKVTKNNNKTYAKSPNLSFNQRSTLIDSSSQAPFAALKGQASE
ncbi:MAG: hypothetical protein ACE5GL_00985 [Calditrichia bacterium]